MLLALRLDGWPMFCQNCGKELPAGSSACPACGYPVAPPRSTARSAGDTLDDAIADLRRAAGEVAQSAASLSRRVADKAAQAAKDPTGSAKRVTRKVADELDRAAKEIEKTLRDL